MNVGYSRTTSPNPKNTNKNQQMSLQTFIKSLPTGSFGSLPWHTNLLVNYKKVVLNDPVFLHLPNQGKRASAAEIGKSCDWMMRTGEYTWLRDLFRLVFGFHLDECEGRKSVYISV